MQEVVLESRKLQIFRRALTLRLYTYPTKSKPL